MELILAVILAAAAAGLVRSVLRASLRANLEVQVATEVTAADFRLQPARWCEFEILEDDRHQRTLARIAGRDPEGVSHHCEAILIPEPETATAPAEVIVAIEGRLVGRLAREDAEEYLDRLAVLGLEEQTAACPAFICGGDVDEYRRRSPYMVKLGLAWPASPESPPEHGPEVAMGAVARLRGAAMSEEEAWHSPPVNITDESELARAFPDGILGREIAFAGWSEDRLPYLRSVCQALGLKVCDPPTDDLAFICVGPRAHERDVFKARAKGVAIISGEQLQQLMS